MATSDRALGFWIMAVSAGLGLALAVTAISLNYQSLPPRNTDPEKPGKALASAGPSQAIRQTMPQTSPAKLIVSDVNSIYRWLGLRLDRIEQAGFSWINAPRPGDWRAGPGINEKHQDFLAYKRSRPVGTKGRGTHIVLRSIGPWPHHMRPVLPVLREYLAIFFQRPTRWGKPLRLPDRYRINTDGAKSHSQYLTAPMLSQLREELPEDALVVLGVTYQDLYPAEDWGFVFGLADLERRIGVVSLRRLFPAFWGQAWSMQSEALGVLRALKVLSHETGHMLGLHHCRAFKCALNGSNSLYENDRTPMHLCPLCLAKLAWNLRLGVLTRYRNLARFYDRHKFPALAAWYQRQAKRLRRSRRRAR